MAKKYLGPSSITPQPGSEPIVNFFGNELQSFLKMTDFPHINLCHRQCERIAWFIFCLRFFLYDLWSVEGRYESVVYLFSSFSIMYLAMVVGSAFDFSFQFTLSSPSVFRKSSPIIMRDFVTWVIPRSYNKFCV